MYDAISFLNWIVARENVFRIVVADFYQWCIFAIFSFNTRCHGHTGLNIRVFRIVATKNEVAFKFPNASNAC